jgi:hypothetical protein
MCKIYLFQHRSQVANVFNVNPRNKVFAIKFLTRTHVFMDLVAIILNAAAALASCFNKLL